MSVGGLCSRGDGAARQERSTNDPLRGLRVDAAVPDTVWIDHQVRSLAAPVETATEGYLYRLSAEQLVQALERLFRAGLAAGRPGANEQVAFHRGGEMANDDTLNDCSGVAALVNKKGLMSPLGTRRAARPLVCLHAINSYKKRG